MPDACPYSTQRTTYGCPWMWIQRCPAPVSTCSADRSNRLSPCRSHFSPLLCQVSNLLSLALSLSLSRYLQSLQARAECLYLSHNVACRQLLQAGRHDEFTKDDIKIAVNNRLDLMLSECTTSQRIMWYSLFSHSRCTS